MSLETTPKPNKRRLAVVGIVVVAAAVAPVVTGISSRAQSDQKLASWANAQAVPTVALVQLTASAGMQDLSLPGTIQAYFATPIFARVPGYVHSWSEDIGARVKKGQTLAEIDTPDLDQ